MYNRFFIRTDDWVLIGDNQGNERTLYDLRTDPHEFFDVLAQAPRRERRSCTAGSSTPRAGRCRTTSSQPSAIAATPATTSAAPPQPAAVHPLVEEDSGQQRGDHDARLAHGGHRRGVGEPQGRQHATRRRRR